MRERPPARLGEDEGGRTVGEEAGLPDCAELVSAVEEVERDVDGGEL